jgi:septal ring factor EnvC (AmiA/AmiB activator)
VQNIRFLATALLLVAGILLVPRVVTAQAYGTGVARTGRFGDPTSTLAELDRRIAESVSRIEQLEAERARAEAEVEALAGARADTNRRLRARTRALYRLTRAGTLPLTGGFSALLSHLGRRERLERIVRADVDALNDLRARSGALREESSRRAGEIEQARAALRGLEEEKNRLGGSLFGGRGGPSAIVASGPTYGLQRGSVIGDSGYGLRLVGPGPSLSSSFESQRGQLLIPLRAPTGMREASREEGVGLEIAGPLGAVVSAAADGRVAFAHSHAAYGRLVIVDHGSSHFTIYGGLGRIDVAVGQTVTRGAALGTLDGSPLFFQVRRGTRALDPRVWLGL